MTIRPYCNLSKENYTILTSQKASTTGKRRNKISSTFFQAYGQCTLS